MKQDLRKLRNRWSIWFRHRLIWLLYKLFPSCL